ncbi:MAG: NADP-dependent oxidoreductase [Alphaproteobacteria bacterium]|nr:NADP-dependent oxidoreductase [Alphaproteobacteria bacterium]
MQAIRYARYGGPEVLQREEVPLPEPGPGQVRVDLRAASVIPADWKVRAGHLKNLFAITFPKIPGRDGAGVIGKLGAGVDYVARGARVCVVAQHVEAGTYAQAIVRDRESLVPLPPNLSFEEGAALMHAGICAWICLVETAQLQAGVRVLIHGGAGAIGGLAIQLARHLGAHVVTTCRAANTDYVTALGAHDVIAYDRADFARTRERFDVVLDLIGGDVHARSYAVLKQGGHMVCLIAAPFVNQAEAFGARVTTARIHDRRPALEAVAALAAQGVLRPQISARMALADAAEAHRAMEANLVTRGRIVLQVPPL